MTLLKQAELVGDELLQLGREIGFVRRGVPLCSCLLAGRSRDEFLADLERREQETRHHHGRICGAIRRGEREPVA